MSAAVLASLQRKVQVLGATLLLVGIGGSVVAVGPVIAAPGSHATVSTYNVTFVKVNGTAPPASGSANYLSSVTATIKIGGSNLTGVVFDISYTDQSLSPFTNPSVNAMITPPNGTVVNGTGGSVPVQSGGTTIILMLPATVPQNTTVTATSEAEALAQAAGNGTNATNGVGDWQITLQVGAAAFGRFRPSGSIQYNIATAVEGFEGRATKV